ncbi:MAG: M14 family metallopeptidase [Thermoanaerobaculia bacterium]
MPSRFRRFAVSPFLSFFLLFLFFQTVPRPAAAAGRLPADLLTPAEAANFAATPDYDATIAFLRRLEGALPQMKLEFYGTSAAGRPMPVVVLSAERAFTSQAARKLAKPIVLIQNGIHAGEIDGKDACLMLLRDLALGRRRELLAAETVLILPIYNVDGHERISPFNRPNQDGPVDGMGFRTTADGHDLNRDYLKLQTPEARALLRLVNEWQPHLVVDNHVTDGVDLDWVITWAVAAAPLLPAPVDAWMQSNFPPILQRVEAAGHKQGPYVSLIDSEDPAKGFETLVFEPRYSSGYFPLRNRPAILIETHSHKPYRERVLATRDFVAAILLQVGKSGAGLRSAIAESEREVVAAGRGDAPASTIALTYEKDAADTYNVPFYAWTRSTSVVSGTEEVHFERGVLQTTEVPWMHRQKIALALPRPRGYLVLPGWPEIERRIMDQGLTFERLASPLELEVETTRLSHPKYAAESYQGLTRVTADAARAVERRKVPAGALWVPADQPNFAVAVQLLEPEAPDSMLSWGLVSGLFEGKEYIDGDALDLFARNALNDPAIAAEWEKALGDPAFAADKSARYRWWFSRTPWWDGEVGLFPVFRVLTPFRH